MEMYYLIMILMKRLSASEEEIDRFRRKHMNFQSVRKYYVKKALEEGDAEKQGTVLLFLSPCFRIEEVLVSPLTFAV